MILGALALGVLIGLSLGALGGGGSILTVPALVFVLGLTAQEATAGSLVIVGVTAAIASFGHARAGNTRWGKGGTLALAGVPASLLGSNLNRDVNPDLLLLAFAGLMVVAAGGMLLHASPTPPTPPTPPATPEPSQHANATKGTVTRTPVYLTSAPEAFTTAVRVIAAGLGIGFLTGFLGVGGGFIIVPVLVVLLRYDMAVAVGTSLLVIALNSAVALVARLGHGGLVWHVVLPFTLAAVVGSLGGKTLGDRIDPASLTRAFAMLLLVVAAYVGVQAGIGTS